jgi:hypothetical protein
MNLVAVLFWSNLKGLEENDVESGIVTVHVRLITGKDLTPDSFSLGLIYLNGLLTHLNRLRESVSKMITIWIVECHV